MEALTLRPRLTSFRALAFHGENRGEANGTQWTLELKQDIHLGIAVPTAPGGVLQALVKIELHAQASNEKVKSEAATFTADYEAKFNYAAGAEEATVTSLLEGEPYQYMLVAQAYPLAMTHFKSELQALGFDARSLPLGMA